MRAHIFDMDGTLLRRTSAPMLLAAALGQPGALTELEARFAGGSATAEDFAHALYEMWGVVDAEVAQQAFTAAPVIANVRAVLADIRERGEHACLITMSPNYFAEQFLEYGFDRVYSSRFPTLAGEPLDVTHILSPEDKPRLAGEFCAEHGLDLGAAVAYGDSMSDVFLFEQVGFRISVNGDHHIAGQADLAVTGEDLLPTYRAARKLFERAS